MNLLSAYYFRAHMYTMVPRHVREDMQWMADLGTHAVTIGVLEQDLTAAVENIQLIAAEADRAGLQLFVTPARWGSLVAGCPKVPSLFSSSRPEVWAVRKNGQPYTNFGPVASVHHPATYEFFVESLEKLFAIAPIRGLIWDELKALTYRDFSASAVTALEGKNIHDLNIHIDAQAKFFERVTAAALRLNPDLHVALFVYGNLEGYAIERLPQINGLTAFGLDGRPWRAEDGGGGDSSRAERATKLLCDQAPAFFTAARKHAKQSFMLIENHALCAEDIDLMDRRLPEVLALGADHLCFYYYPRSVSDPDRAMNVLAKHLRQR